MRCGSGRIFFIDVFLAVGIDIFEVGFHFHALLRLVFLEVLQRCSTSCSRTCGGYLMVEPSMTLSISREIL